MSVHLQWIHQKCEESLCITRQHRHGRVSRSGLSYFIFMFPLSLHPVTFQSHSFKLQPLISHTFPLCSPSVDLYTCSSSSSLEFVSFTSRDVRHSADPALWKPPPASHAHPWWGLQSLRARHTHSKAEVVWLWHRKRNKKPCSIFLQCPPRWFCASSPLLTLPLVSQRRESPRV